MLHLQEVKSLFDSLGTHQPSNSLISLLAQLVGRLGRDVGFKFLAEKACLPNQSCVSIAPTRPALHLDNFDIAEQRYQNFLHSMSLPD